MSWLKEISRFSQLRAQDINKNYDHYGWTGPRFVDTCVKLTILCFSRQSVDVLTLGFVIDIVASVACQLDPNFRHVSTGEKYKTWTAMARRVERRLRIGVPVERARRSKGCGK